ncbi:hypothetical protein [Alteraurantiacibacter palmitatis]|uniref:DUF4261 domain-containing protein n=1 Tax=Alteraurantiacibacter palmitatis TaxID=2054628 RepID=A0ABV7E4L1_9SPHN
MVLLFAQHQRPSLARIQALSLTHGQFAVTLDSVADEGKAGEHGALHWCELLANGLTFDLTGLSPGVAAAMPEMRHFFALDAKAALGDCEAMALTPGPHLLSGGAMIPVLRCLAWLAGELAELENIAGVAWGPAATVCAPGYFRDAVTRWLGGGAFPGLGLTALRTLEDGSLQSEGLSLFTGQELLLVPDAGGDPQRAAKLALRLLHWLVDMGRITHTMSLTGREGEPILLEPQDADGERPALVCVSRGAR